MAFNPDQFVATVSNELFETMRVCLEHGCSFTWRVVPFDSQKRAFEIKFSQSGTSGSYDLTIGGRVPLDRLRSIPGVIYSPDAGLAGSFPIDWKHFYSAESPARQFLLTIAPLMKSLKGKYVHLWVDDESVTSFVEARAAAPRIGLNAAYRTPGASPIAALFLGGSGSAIADRSVVSFEFGPSGFLVRDLSTRKDERILYSDVHSLEIGGSTEQTGGGFSGGGFGVTGFVVGAAASAALNKLTTKSNLRTEFRISTKTGEMNFSTNQISARDLDLLLADARVKIRQGQTSQSLPPPPLPPVQVSLAEELRKLGELRQAGVLTEAEFLAAKSRLLS